MEYDELRTLLLHERRQNKLQKVSDAFYNQLEDFIETQDDWYAMRSKEVSGNEIKHRRYLKIINWASTNACTYEEVEIGYLTDEEKQFYNDCKELFESWVTKKNIHKISEKKI